MSNEICSETLTEQRTIDDAVTGLYETHQPDRAHALRVVTNALQAEVAALTDRLGLLRGFHERCMDDTERLEAEVAALRAEVADLHRRRVNLIVERDEARRALDAGLAK